MTPNPREYRLSKTIQTDSLMYLVAIAWMYVVVMMTVVEATSQNGTVIGAIFTFLLYGALPLSVVLYILRTPTRKRARRIADGSAAEAPADAVSDRQPDRGDHASGHAIATEGKKP